MLAAAVVLAGCRSGDPARPPSTSSVSGTAAPLLSAVDSAQALLPAARVAQILGSPVAKTNRLLKPYRAIDSTKRECAVVQGMTAEGFGIGWTSFSGTEMLAGSTDESDVMAYQGIAVFPDAPEAAGWFADAAHALQACNGAALSYRDEGMDIPVTVEVSGATGPRIAWLVRYEPSLYRCFGTARVVVNALLQTQVCAYNNSRDMVQAMADGVGARLMSGH